MAIVEFARGVPVGGGKRPLPRPGDRWSLSYTTDDVGRVVGLTGFSPGPSSVTMVVTARGVSRQFVVAAGQRLMVDAADLSREFGGPFAAGDAVFGASV